MIYLTNEALYRYRPEHKSNITSTSNTRRHRPPDPRPCVPSARVRRRAAAAPPRPGKSAAATATARRGGGATARGGPRTRGRAPPSPGRRRGETGACDGFRGSNAFCTNAIYFFRSTLETGRAVEKGGKVGGGRSACGAPRAALGVSGREPVGK